MAKDFLGHEISIGDSVVYPGRKGSELWLNYGVVTNFENVDDIIVETENGRRVKIKRVDRVVVV